MDFKLIETENFVSFNENGSNKYILSKLDHELYKEEDDIINPIVRVKKISTPNKGKKWKIIINDKTIFTIEGIKLSKKEKEYLETIEGFNFMLTQGKSGIKSFHSFRTSLRKLIPISKRKPRKQKK